MFNKIKNITWAIIITGLITIYGFLNLYYHSNGTDFTSNGIAYFLDYYKEYAAACGVVWVNYLLSIDRAKKRN